MVLTFFSLTPSEAAEYRGNLFTQLHEIVFHGKGGYDFPTIYDMPIWLRNFTWKKMSEYYEEQNNASKSSNPNSTNDITKAKELIAKAHKSDPRTRHQPTQSKPDFVTTSKRPLRKS